MLSPPQAAPTHYGHIEQSFAHATADETERASWERQLEHYAARRARRGVWALLSPGRHARRARSSHRSMSSSTNLTGPSGPPRRTMGSGHPWRRRRARCVRPAARGRQVGPGFAGRDLRDPLVGHGPQRGEGGVVAGRSASRNLCGRGTRDLQSGGPRRYGRPDDPVNLSSSMPPAAHRAAGDSPRSLLGSRGQADVDPAQGGREGPGAAG